MNFGMVVYNHEWIIFCSLTVDLKGQGHRSPVMNSCENHVLACISEVNEPVGMNFGVVVYNHEWIIFCSLGVDLKGQGHQSPVMNSCENHVLACISEVNGPVGMNFGVVMYNHEWIIFLCIEC